MNLSVPGASITPHSVGLAMTNTKENDLMIIERGEMSGSWICLQCTEENQLTCPVWEDSDGEFLAVECPDCGGVEYMQLKEKGDN